VNPRSLSLEEEAVLLAVFTLGAMYTDVKREELLEEGELGIVKSSGFKKKEPIPNPIRTLISLTE
jgi:hypothetical protein